MPGTTAGRPGLGADCEDPERVSLRGGSTSARCGACAMGRAPDPVEAFGSAGEHMFRSKAHMRVPHDYTTHGCDGPESSRRSASRSQERTIRPAGITRDALITEYLPGHAVRRAISHRRRCCARYASPAGPEHSPELRLLCCQCLQHCQPPAVRVSPPLRFRARRTRHGARIHPLHRRRRPQRRPPHPGAAHRAIH